jgi:hypothetical protein
MRQQKNATKKIRIGYVVLILVLSLAIAVQTIKPALAQTEDTLLTNEWAMNLKVTGPNSNNALFAPFDLIQLSANVTYGNIPYTNGLVSFKVEGPADVSNTINITRITSTNTNGLAEFSFHIPVGSQESNSIVGTWRVVATVQTTEGVIEKTAIFNIQWPVTISSITLLNSKNQNQTIFPRENNVTARLIVLVSNQLIRTVNVSITVQDTSGKIISRAQTKNVQVNTTSPNQIQTTFFIPINSSIGEATLNATVNSGIYGDTEIPVSEIKSASFAVVLVNEDENSPSVYSTLSGLFPWLLLATGIVCFMLLLTLFRRRHKTMSEPKPKILPTIPKPQMSIQIQPSGSTQEPPPTVQSPKPPVEPVVAIQPVPRVAGGGFAKATVLPVSPVQGHSVRIRAGDTTLEPPMKSTALTRSPAELPSQAASLETLTRRIQYLKNEKQKISDDLNELNASATTQANMLETEIQNLNQDIQGLRSLLNENQEQPIQQPMMVVSKRSVSATPQGDVAAPVVSQATKTVEEEIELMEAGYDFVAEVNGVKIFKGTQKYTTKATRSVEEARQLIADNYEYVAELYGTSIFRKPEKFSLRVATTVEEALKLAEAGYEYVAQLHGAKVFRKKTA